MTSIGLKDTWRLEGRIENDRWVLEHVRNLPDAMSIEKFQVYFEDLFNGNKELSKFFSFFFLIFVLNFLHQEKKRHLIFFFFFLQTQLL